MANKQIQDFTEQTTSVSTDKILMQDVGGTTKYIQSINLKRDGYEDLKPTGGHTPGGVAAPATVNTIGLHEMLEFSGTTDKHITFIYHVPHDFVEGSDLFFHIHHLPTAVSPSGTVDWTVHYQYAQGYQFGTFSGTDLDSFMTVDLTATSALQYDHMITEGLAINDAVVGSVIRTDGIFIATLYRHATTDTSVDAEIFLEMDMHYLSDGTKTVNKNDTGSGFTKV